MMGKLLLGLALVVTASCADRLQEPASPQGQSQLAGALSGRSAERALSCVNVYDLRGQRLFPRDQAVLFEGRGSLLYLNQFNGECSSLRDGLSLRLATPTGRLCEGDIMEVFDAAAGISHGACALGPFTPYRRRG